MIDSLTFKRLDESALPWADNLGYFKSAPRTEFKPGLNIVFGANGSGKSTVLQLLATSLAALQGGTSVVTSDWMRGLFGFRGNGLNLPCDVVHDGQPVMFFDARAREGLMGGSFDDDFFDLGVANALSKGSTGQLGLQRLDRVLQVLLKKQDAEAPPPVAAPKPEPKPASRGKTLKDLERRGGAKSLVPQGFPKQVEWRVPREGYNESSAARLALVEELLRAKRPVGPKTFILDEPESGYSLPWQARLWEILSNIDPERHQVIVATHCPFALCIPGANYIEITPGYLLECQAAMLAQANRFIKNKESTQ